MRSFWGFFFGLMLLLAAGTTFLVWRALKPMPAGHAALAALASTESVSVALKPYGIEFAPKGKIKGGLVFYPGARVDHRAYAPVLNQVAARGYLVALLWAPFNLATTKQNKAAEVLALHPGISWAAGGHSLGGVAASNYALSEKKVRGLVLWASYPQADLSARTLDTLVVLAGNDGLVSAQSVEQARKKLPSGARLVRLKGLNHAGFGDYGPQPGDGEATLDQQEGWRQIADTTARFLDRIMNSNP